MADEIKPDEVRVQVRRKVVQRPLFSISMDDYLRLLYMQTNYIAVVFSSFTLQKRCPNCGAPMYREYLFRRLSKRVADKPDYFHFVCLRCGYNEQAFYEVEDAP